MNKLTNDPPNSSGTASDNSKDSSKTHKHYHSSADVIIDNEEGGMFDVDWDTIERNYRHRHYHRHSPVSGMHNDNANDSSKKNGSPKADKSDNDHTSGKKHHFSNAHTSKKSRPANGDKKKWSKKKKVLIGILLFFFCVIAGITATFFIMRYLGHETMLNYDNMKMELPEDIDYENNGRTVYYNGHTYEFNDNIASVLFMGIDNRELLDDAVAATSGQADALYLFTYDTSNGQIKVLCINRDTMAEVIRYNAAGKYYDTETKQLCLAYAYGNGKTSSAENQVTAVERLIYNIPINAYYAIDLSAIKVLNDDIGGVTLTPEYTFRSFTKGRQVTIKGDMAEEFVRYRDINMVDDNLRRMSCQRLYINAFTNQIVPAIKKDISIPLKLYQDTSEYTVTNINPTVMTYLASSLAMNYSGLNMITTEGTYKMVEGDASAEFHLDKDDFFEKILDIYYIQVK